MKIEIETRDNELLQSMVGVKAPEVGTPIKLSDDVRLQFSGTILRTGMIPGLPQLLQFTLDVASGAVSSILAAWLYDKLKNRVESVRIDKVQVPIDEAKLKAAIQDCLDAEGKKP